MAKILIVEDDLVAVDVLAEMLEGVGHTILRAGNAVAGLNLLAGSRAEIDMVIVDLVLPDLSGIQLIERIREKRPTMPIVVISGYLSPSSVSVRETLGALGVMEMLAKPFDRHDLLAAVLHALEGR